jgi:hypothetical protein
MAWLMLLAHRALRVLSVRLTVVALIAVGCVSFLEVPKAHAANVTFSQCNDFGPGPGGATTGMRCDVTIVNTINGPTRGSTITVTRTCSLDPCPGGGNTVGSVTTTSGDLVTSVDQCNRSANDSAHLNECNVTITNNISADTPGALPLAFATLNQCIGSAQGNPPGTNNCSPPNASTSGATVTQCNGSANGGGGTIACQFDTTNRVSPALPITVNQCNGTGNPGGSTVTCRAAITTNITAAPGGGSTGGTTTTGGTTGGTTGSTTGGTTGSSTGGTTGAGTGGTTAGTTTGGASGGGTTGSSTGGQVGVIPRGGVDTGGGSTAGGVPAWMPLALLGLTVAGALLWRRRMA